MRSARIFLSAAAFAAAIGNAAAYDPLGTAGTFRSFGWAHCDKGFAARFRGECDPPPVDAALPAAEQSRAEVQRAVALISLIRMEQARAALDAALRLDPQNVAALTLRARLALPAQPQAAQADINAALQLAPLDADALATRAEVLLLLRATEPALRDADEALKRRPDDADAHCIRARILVALGKLEAADDDLSQALLLEPDEPRAHIFRAQLRLRLGRLPEAIEDATRTLDAQPGNASAREVRAIALATTGHADAAIEDLTFLLGPPGQPTNVNPAVTTFHELFVRRAILLVRLGREHEALQDLDTVVRLGGPRAILRLQVYLRNNGFPDLPLDGQRSAAFDGAMKTCFIDEACGRGVVKAI